MLKMFIYYTYLSNMEKTVKGSVMILYMMSCCDDSTLSAVPV